MKWPRFGVAGTREERARLRAIKERHQWQMGQAVRMGQLILAKGGVPYYGTVPKSVIRKRRRKNKAARAARRLNRG